MNSKSKKPASPIRVFGQPSICSLLPIPSRDSKGKSKDQASRKSESASDLLSHFLDRKLQKSSVLPQIVQGKSMPFQSPLGLRTPTWEQHGHVKQVEKERGVASDKVIFERFKHNDEEIEDLVEPLCADELEGLLVDDDIQESRKRKNPFEGGNENQTVRNNVVVLGGDQPKLKQKVQQIETDSSNIRPRRPPYNHFANGRGWWDYDMEGVDNEALGATEVWEGVGTTTLGGIVDWH